MSALRQFLAGPAATNPDDGHRLMERPQSSPHRAGVEITEPVSGAQRAAWTRNDPAELHWHIGPLAVVQAYRRQGVGRRMMVHCCRHLDSLAATAWLETGLAINASFYKTLGFDTIRHQPVLGLPNWFMRRPPPVDRGDEGARVGPARPSHPAS